MLVLYLDDSSAVESSVATLAGYLAPATDWQDFALYAKDIYKKYGVDILHAKEFNDTKKCFKGWNYRRKKSFILELYQLSQNMLGLSSSVRKANFSKMRDEAGLPPSMSAYGYILSNLLKSLRWSEFTKETMMNSGIAIFIESGNNNQNELRNIVERFDSLTLYKKCIKSLKFVDKSYGPNIQLADFFAFYSRRQAAKIVANDLVGEQSRVVEEKMFTLITSQCEHLINIHHDVTASYFPIYHWAGDKNNLLPPNQTHTYLARRIPSDPK